MLFVLFIGIAPIFQSCGWWQNTQPSAAPNINETKADTPFPVNEPQVFQADLIRSDGVNETRSFYARKGDRWRFDMFAAGQISQSMIRTDKIYLLRHDKKLYSETVLSDAASAVPDFVGELTSSLLRRREHADFVEMESNGNVTKYKVRLQETGAEAFVDFDRVLGIIVKEEFRTLDPPASFVFEVKNVKLEADDDLFQIPAGYRKISRDELNKMPIKWK